MSTVSTLYNINAAWNGFGLIKVIKVEHDGASGAEVIASTQGDKAALNQIFLLAIHFSEDGAPDLTFSSTDTLAGGGDILLAPLELAANQGSFSKIDTGFLLAAKKGESLQVNSSVAINMTCFVVEARDPVLR